MNNWIFYIEKWAKEKHLNLKLLIIFKEEFIRFTSLNDIDTNLKNSFQLTLFKNIEKFEKNIITSIIDFVIWFYKDRNISINHFQIKHLVEKTKGTSFINGKRSDPKFLWSLHYDVTLYNWITFFSTYLELQNKSYSLYRQAFNNFLDYLIYFPEISRDIYIYININYQIPETFKNYFVNIKMNLNNGTGLRNNLSKLNDFFEWFLIINCTSPENNQLIDIKYKNPIQKIVLKNVKSVESHRNALPTRYINMLKNIITSDNYAWPKTLKNEWSVHNGEKIWSPVTSYLVLLKLITPIRTHQLRYLDSGEGDQYYFNYNIWNWEKNKTYLYENLKDYKGVLKRLIDNNTQKELIGLYINTNKTKDTYSDSKGYTIPWENKEIIKIISDLTIWQKKYNPVTTPLKWIHINDVQLKKKSKEDLMNLGENFFLFRDTYNENPEEPIMDFRVQYYWKMLLGELERRVNKERKLSDENPIYFIEKWQGKKPLVAYYDLHSLRVTILTALHQVGVPYSILSKYLAGHSTIIMTMYYVKYNQSHISETLNDATKEMTIKEQNNFNTFIANANYQELEKNLVYNDNSALSAITQLKTKSCMTSDIGICPVGENKCLEGSDSFTKQGGQNVYKPVENGPKNCIRCRFFITGVPFLLGLSSRFNELAITIKEKTNVYKKAEKEYEDLFDERYINEKENKPFLKWKDLEIADSNYNKYNNELNQLLIDWQYLYNLIEQCQIIQKKQNKEISSKFSLITNENINDLNVAIKECSKFELYDEVCQSSIFYKSIQPNIANMKRNKIINKMFLNNDLKPYFLLLDEEESIYAANQFVKLLMVRIGKSNALDVLNDKKRLQDLGLNIDIKNEIEELINNKYQFDDKTILRIKNEK